MSILIVALVIVFLPVLWIICFPVNISVDTRRGLYRISQPATINVSFHPNESPAFRLRILGWPVDMRYREKVKQPDRKKQRRSSRMKSPRAWMRLLSGVVNSFRCRRFICRVDFDDVVLNAQLFAIAYFSSSGPVVVDVNFRKQYELDVWIQLRIYRVLWSFMRFFVTK